MLRFLQGSLSLFPKPAFRAPARALSTTPAPSRFPTPARAHASKPPRNLPVPDAKRSKAPKTADKITAVAKSSLTARIAATQPPAMTRGNGGKQGPGSVRKGCTKVAPVAGAAAEATTKIVEIAEEGMVVKEMTKVSVTKGKGRKPRCSGRTLVKIGPSRRVRRSLPVAALWAKIRQLQRQIRQLQNVQLFVHAATGPSKPLC
ncbi:hypothetical protein DFJ74DRAFT_704742 [Hyaloraphidium curvatum]|nr:hypothetical protein DFJ74DRAFT_704742 [Hyaloraphidium curvatum]